MKIKGKEIEVQKCNTLFSKIRGLMFRDKEKAPAILLFDFKKPRRLKIHSFFCHKFFAVWLDEKNKIIDMKVVKPWRLSISSRKQYSKLVEIPINKRYKEIIQILVGTRKV